MRNDLNLYLVTLLGIVVVCGLEIDAAPRENENVGIHLSEDDTPSLDLEVELLDLGFNMPPSDHKYVSESYYTPVVLWHGMGDSARGSINIINLALQERYPGIKVFSVQIGKNVIEDVLSGYFVNVNRQVDSVCKAILREKGIMQSFNAIGFSQGAQFMRGLIERCPFKIYGIEVKNFISLGGQHQGVFGLPNCGLDIVCDHIRELLTTAAYEKQVQDHVVQAEYWHDPYQEDKYRTQSAFLADINNENHIDSTYRDNLLQLHNMVLVEFTEDHMVVPRESSLFGFYAANNTQTIVSMEESRLYKEDRIGLKELRDSNRLSLIKVPGDHLQYTISWFLNEIGDKYLSEKSELLEEDYDWDIDEEA